MKTIDKIITKIDGKYGAPMGRVGVGNRPGTGKTWKEAGIKKRVFDCLVPMSGDGVYDKGGAYWGLGKRLRVSYTKDMSYIHFYREAA